MRSVIVNRSWSFKSFFEKFWLFVNVFGEVIIHFAQLTFGILSDFDFEYLLLILLNFFHIRRRWTFHWTLLPRSKQPPRPIPFLARPWPSSCCRGCCPRRFNAEHFSVEGVINLYLLHINIVPEHFATLLGKIGFCWLHFGFLDLESAKFCWPTLFWKVFLNVYIVEAFKLLNDALGIQIRCRPPRLLKRNLIVSTYHVSIFEFILRLNLVVLLLSSHRW